jgi:hypothetical protein
MPDWELPELFQKWPKEWQPTRIDFGRLRFPCPIEGWKGSLTLSWHVSAEEFLIFYEKALQSPEVQDNEDDEHYAAVVWNTRFHFIKNIDLKRIDGAEIENSTITDDPKTVPDMRLMTWFVSISQEVLIDATSLPNLPRPSRDTLNL